MLATAPAACPRTFTVHTAKRAIDATFAGVKTVRRVEYARLRHLIRCQRNPAARPYVRWVWRDRQAKWNLRRHPPAPAFSGPVIASWYDDSGTTGCGFHATYGIAALNVPCGAQVTLKHGSATVVAVRDDSGPYVAGRTFDLNPAVKAALGCPDLCSVLWR